MKNIYTVTFSPTGTSKMVAGLISSAFDGEKIDIDLCMEKNRKLTADGDDLCVFSLPCYGGRVPHTAAERLAGICGQSTPAIICVTFGNRDFEDSLLELSDIVSENGFRVISACAASTEHNIIRVFGAGRPDETDIKEIKQFAADSLDKIISGCRKSPYIPGNRPYKQWKAGDTPIITDKDRCTGCGICSSMCPVQAISPDGKKPIQKSVSAVCAVSGYVQMAAGAFLSSMLQNSQNILSLCAAAGSQIIFICLKLQ